MRVHPDRDISLIAPVGRSPEEFAENSSRHREVRPLVREVGIPPQD
jgi:hypothetical protein